MSNFSQILFGTMFAGLGNTQTVEHSTSFATLSIGAFGTSSTTVSIPITSGATLNRIQIRLSGLENDTWRPITSQLTYYNDPVVASATQGVAVFPGVSGNNIQLTVTRFNETGGAINLTAFTLQVKIRVMRPPF